MAKTGWCRRILAVVKDRTSFGNIYRCFSVSKWFNSRDHIGEGETQQPTTRWSPKKKLTRYQMEYLRSLRSESPELWTLRRLSKYFGISYISVVKILKSKFHPSEEVVERQDARASKLREQRKHLLKEKILAVNKAKRREMRNTTGIKNTPFVVDKADK